MLYVMMYVFRLIYYMFFESVFGASPAKFLSETRTLNVDGSRPGFKKILLRTLCRFVPFEPFSFFAVNDQYHMPVKGWHDKWTRTVVVQEQQTGVKGSRYFLLIPFFILLGVAVVVAHWRYEEHLSYFYHKHEHEQKIQEIEHGLKNLSSLTIIKLTDAGRPYSSEATYLKPIMTGINSHTYVQFTVESDYNYNMVMIGELLEQKSESMQQVNIADSMLKKAFTKDYNRYRKRKQNTADLLGNGKQYEITSVAMMYQPIIKTGSSSLRYEGGEGNISLGLENSGWKTRLIDIKNLKGSIVWKNTLPQEIEGATNKLNKQSFSIFGTYTKYNEKYDVLVSFENEYGERKVYRVKGRGLDRSLTEVYPDTTP